MVEGRINRIVAPSFLDGPGSRMAIFMQGCDLACGICHNPETWNHCGGCGLCVPGCPGGALEAGAGGERRDPALCLACDRCLEACPSHSSPKVRNLTVDALLAEVRPWVPYLDGVTFSGGECTLQWEFLVACLPRLKEELGLPVLLDTNGNMKPEVLEALLPVCDGLLFDVKALEPEVHQSLTGTGNGRILRNLRRAAKAGKVVEVRMVLVPGATADPETVREVAVLVRDLGGSVPLRLSPFRPQGARGAWAEVPELGAEVLEELRSLVE